MVVLYRRYDMISLYRPALAQGKTNWPITKLIPLEVSQSSDVTRSAADDTKNCISDHAETTDGDSISLTQLPSSNHGKITSEIKDRP